MFETDTTAVGNRLGFAMTMRSNQPTLANQSERNLPSEEV
jgi:hypothetical protein